MGLAIVLLVLAAIFGAGTVLEGIAWMLVLAVLFAVLGGVALVRTLAGGRRSAA